MMRILIGMRARGVLGRTRRCSPMRTTSRTCWRSTGSSARSSTRFPDNVTYVDAHTLFADERRAIPVVELDDERQAGRDAGRRRYPPHRRGWRPSRLHDLPAARPAAGRSATRRCRVRRRRSSWRRGLDAGPGQRELRLGQQLVQLDTDRRAGTGPPAPPRRPRPRPRPSRRRPRSRPRARPRRPPAPPTPPPSGP